jgi:predicted O-methyltransferase YrrM
MSGNPNQWAAVDRYLCERLVAADEALSLALRQSDAAGLPSIAVSAAQGKLLHLLARSIGARRILEIGTLGGYSAIWLGRAVAPAGKVVSLELDPKHAVEARKNLDRAGLSHIIDIRIGAALDLLPQLQPVGPFDFTFIDADKANCWAYFDWAVKLSRPGAMIVVDNVVRNGAIVDSSKTGEDVNGVRMFLERAGRDPRVDLTALQTVGSKGYDGFALAIVC